MCSNYGSIVLVIGGLWAAVNLGAAPPEQAPQERAVRLTMCLVSPTVRVGATNIPAKLIVDNGTEDTIQFRFIPATLWAGVSDSALGSVQLTVPPGANVHKYPPPASISVRVWPVTLKPGGKFVAEVNLAKFIEPVRPGECEIVVRPVGIRYVRVDASKDSEATGLMTGESRLRLKVTE